jgi:hypothetical protein
VIIVADTAQHQHPEPTPTRVELTDVQVAYIKLARWVVGLKALLNEQDTQEQPDDLLSLLNELHCYLFDVLSNQEKVLHEGNVADLFLGFPKEQYSSLPEESAEYKYSYPKLNNYPLEEKLTSVHAQLTTYTETAAPELQSKLQRFLAALSGFFRDLLGLEQSAADKKFALHGMANSLAKSGSTQSILQKLGLPQNAKDVVVERDDDKELGCEFGTASDYPKAMLAAPQVLLRPAQAPAPTPPVPETATDEPEYTFILERDADADDILPPKRNMTLISNTTPVPKLPVKDSLDAAMYFSDEDGAGNLPSPW